VRLAVPALLSLVLAGCAATNPNATEVQLVLEKTPT
jgi:hypothetical protein